MLKKLEKDRLKIASPDRDEIIRMVCEAMENTPVDNVRAFKNLFLTNDLNGSEDWLVSDKIIELVGNEIKEFRQQLMKEKCPKNLQELLNTITPPKGLKRNFEGFELYDCEDDEIEDSVENEVLEKSDDEEEDIETQQGISLTLAN